MRFYLMIAVSGLILLAGVVLVVLQWDKNVLFSLYGKSMNPPTWLLMLTSAAGGVVAWALIKVLWRGIVGLHRLRCSGGGAATEGGAS
jgi:hypothetical protein